MGSAAAAGCAQRGEPYCRACGEDDHETRCCPWSRNPEPAGALVTLPGQPICKHYTGATLANQSGDYSCTCLAGVPYDRWTPDMERWPCRRRHLLGLEQHACKFADYGSDVASDVDKQLTEMTLRAIDGHNEKGEPAAGSPTH